MAVAWEVVCRHAQSVRTLHHDRARTRGLQQVVAVEADYLHLVREPDVKLLHGVDLVVVDVETTDVRHALERAGLDGAQVRLLDSQHVHVTQAAERVTLQRLQVHER